MPKEPGMPQVIVIGGLKGGIGKSTLAMFIAFTFALIYKQRVLLVDADPSSQTACDWRELADKRGTPLPFDVKAEPHARVAGEVTRMAKGNYDVVVIDCGGHEASILSSAVSIADYVYVATTAFRADVRRVAATFAAAARAAQDAGRAEEISAHVVFLRVDKRQTAKNEGQQEAVAERLPVLNAKMSYRPAIYADAFSEGPPPMENLTEVQDILKETGVVA